MAGLAQRTLEVGIMVLACRMIQFNQNPGAPAQQASALDHLMRDACRGLVDFDAVLVWKLDRFGRSLQHLQRAVGELECAGVSFVSRSDGFDLTTPVGRLMFQMLGALAEFERNIIAERIRAGM